MPIAKFERMAAADPRDRPVIVDETQKSASSQ
jgi:hypothetical protein